MTERNQLFDDGLHRYPTVGTSRIALICFKVERLMVDGQFPVGVQPVKGLNIRIQTLISLSWYNWAGLTCAVMCSVSGSWSIDSRPSLPGAFIIIHWCHIRVALATLAFGEPMACLFSPVLDNSFTEYHPVFAWSTDAFLEHLNYQATR